MTGHVQLKFVMTECSKTQIRLAGLILFICLSVHSSHFLSAATSQIAAALASQAGQKGDSESETALAASSIEAQRDVYRRMLNYSMSSALTQQYYLSQYGYNYLQVIP